MGAGFSQYLAHLEAGGASAPARPGVERFAYVRSGEVLVRTGEGSTELGPGAFAYLPPDLGDTLEAQGPASLIVFERPYAADPSDPESAPERLAGQVAEVPPEPFQGDPRAQLRTLLPEEPRFDMAVNVFSFQAGATLPLVEVHVMEHGLTFLEGEGVYRLSESWYRVAEGDTIWMAPYCPQWFAATGTEPATYLYYKDVHRAP